jgi:hypothetical protein
MKNHPQCYWKFGTLITSWEYSSMGGSNDAFKGIIMPKSCIYDYYVHMTYYWYKTQGIDVMNMIIEADFKHNTLDVGWNCVGCKMQTRWDWILNVSKCFLPRITRYRKVLFHAMALCQLFSLSLSLYIYKWGLLELWDKKNKANGIQKF